jgi:hypothetical protein
LTKPATIEPELVQVKKKKKKRDDLSKIDFQHRRGRRGHGGADGHMRSNKTDWDKFNEHDRHGEANMKMKPPENPLMDL